MSVDLTSRPEFISEKMIGNYKAAGNFEKTGKSGSKYLDDENKYRDDVKLSGDAESALYHYRSLKKIHERVESALREEEFYFEKKSFTITFEEIWEENKNMPPSISSEERAKRFIELSSEKSAQEIESMIRDAVDGSHSKDRSELKDSITKALEIGFGNSLSEKNRSDDEKNISDGIYHSTYDKIIKKIENIF